MGRPISGEYRIGRRLLTGLSDPSGLNLTFELEPNAVTCAFDARRHVPRGGKMVSAGLVQSVADDAAHAAIAALKKRLGVVRESRLRFLRPLYQKDLYRAAAHLKHDADDGVLRVGIDIRSSRGEEVIDGEVEIFLLSADQVRRMSPDGMIPLELQRFLPTR